MVNQDTRPVAFAQCHGFYVELRPLDCPGHWQVQILGERFGWVDRINDFSYRLTREDQSAGYFTSLQDVAANAWVDWCQVFVVSYLRGSKYDEPECPF
jgi:hypothetical protein